MSQQLNLFPGSSLDSTESDVNDRLADLTAELNAIDEMFAASSFYRSSHEFLKLLNFIAHFPNYSAFNCFLLYTQNPSISYVATARTWARKFRRRLKSNTNPLLILAPMAPVRFLFDIKDTEGDPVAPELLKPYTPKKRFGASVYDNTVHNSLIQGIVVQELALEDPSAETAARMTPSVRKKYKNLHLKKDASYLIILNKARRLEEKYENLVLELGHIFCGHLGIDKNAWWSERHSLAPLHAEIEAQSVAFLICQRKGLISSTEKYVSSYLTEDQEIPVISLNALLQAVNYIEEMGKSRWDKPRKRSRY
ncbi:MAG: hypothetical protein PVG15_13305 [Desulfobacterales bacterium]|jgi:hypothetical protein